MPLNGEKVEELLSGYLDGMLSEAESAEFERALEDAAVRKRYDELVETRQRLRDVRDARQQAAPGLSANFAAKVWAEIETRRVTVHTATQDAPGTQSAGTFSTGTVGSRRRWLAWSAVVAGVAAVLLLVVNPLLNSPSNQIGGSGDAGNAVAVIEPTAADVDPESPFSGPLDNTDFAQGGSSTDESSTALDAGKLVTEQWRQQVMLTVVVDIQLSQNAVSEDFLAKTFRAHGIELQQPVLADAEALRAISDSRMIERPEEDAGDALLYFVHAESVAIDRAVQVFMNDVVRVPKMWTDVAFDTPINQLMLRIISSAGKQFSIEQSFAAQVTVRRSSGSTAALEGIYPQGKPVSRTARESNDSSSSLNTGATVPDGKSTILLVVRLPK